MVNPAYYRLALKRSAIYWVDKRKGVHEIGTLGGKQEMTIINESGFIL